MKIINILRIFVLVLIVPTAVLADDRDADIDELANMSLEELSQMVMSVSKKPEPSFQAAAAVYVLKREDIVQSGATSIQEALRLVPGMEVHRGRHTNYAVSTRGFTEYFSNKLLVLIDGRTVYTPLFSGVYWDGQDILLDDIDRIEVIRGPGATLWGANAVNGVINIITRAARESLNNYASVQVGTEDSEVSLRSGTTIGENNFVRIFAKAFERTDDESINGDGDDKHYRMFHTGFRMDSDLSDRQRVTLQGDFYRGQEEYKLFLPNLVPPAFEEIRQDDLNTFGGNMLFRWDYDSSKDVSHSLQGYLDVASYDYDVLDQEIYTYDVEYKQTRRINTRNEVVFGTGFRAVDDKLMGSPFLTFTPEERTTYLYNAFIQDEISVIEDRFKIIIGAKFEKNSFTDFEIQPTIRSVWTPNEVNTIWAAVSRAVRTPSRADDDVFLAIFNLKPGIARWQGNRDFKSEEVLSYELGYRHNFANRVALDIATFINDYDKLRTFELVGGGLPDPAAILQVQNLGSGESFGVDVTVAAKLAEWLFVDTSYNYFDLDLSLDSRSTDVTLEAFEGQSPEHQVRLRSRMYLPYGWSISPSFSYVDELRSLNISGYSVLDTRVAWRISPSTEVSVVGRNLLESEHQEFNNPLQTEAFQIPRSVYAKVAFRF